MTATPEQIERVAMAIRDAVVLRYQRGGPRDWGSCPEQLRQSYREEAKAAIAAYEAG